MLMAEKIPNLEIGIYDPLTFKSGHFNSGETGYYNFDATDFVYKLTKLRTYDNLIS